MSHRHAFSETAANTYTQLDQAGYMLLNTSIIRAQLVQLGPVVPLLVEF